MYVSKEAVDFSFRVSDFTLKMEAAGYSETSVHLYKITWRYVQE
jgi:hypothetical protein